MSHMNGIGSSQQFPVTTDAVAVSNTGRTARTDASATTQAGPGGSSVDQASVSGTANVVAQALSVSDVRMDRVASLQSAIAAGTYSVPASDVASRLLSSLMN